MKPTAWYADSIAVMTCLLIIATVIGRGLAGLVAWRFRALARAFLSPTLGLSVLILLAIAIGWLGHGYKRSVCLLAVLVLLGWALRQERSARALVGHALLVSVFGVAATLGTLAVVWQFGAFNPYNDAFTYLVHSQWLQTHGFNEPASASGYHPALTQVLCYQRLGLRMGASFFFGFVQALTGTEWSYQIWPVVIALPLVATGLSVAAAAYWVSRRRVVSLVAGCLVGVTLNGFAYGAAHGYLPQTYGLALLSGGLLLLGIHGSYASTGPRWRCLLLNTIPVALVIAATIHSYSEAFPFLAATIVVSSLCWFAWRPKQARHLAAAFGMLIVLTTLFVNGEWIRALHAIRTQSHAVVGEAVPWPVSQFLAHGLGLRAGIEDGELYLLPRNGRTVGLGVIILLGTVGAAAALRQRHGRWLVLPHLVLLGLCALAFAHFRYQVPSPWPQGSGQTWNQFKLANWATPSLYVLLAVGLAVLARLRRPAILGPAVAGMVVLLLLGFGFAQTWRLTGSRIRSIRDDTGLNRYPFRAFFSIRESAGALDPSWPIYLEPGFGKVGCRQMLMYALMDRPVAGDWSDDEWVKHWLPMGERSLPVDTCEWIVTSEEGDAPPSPSAGHLTLRKRPRTRFELVACTGGHAREIDNSGWWYWTEQNLSFDYRAVGQLPRKVVVDFRYRPVGDNRPVEMALDTTTPQTIRMKLGENSYQSAPMTISNDTFRLQFTCALPPVPLPNGDNRPASYLIKNLKVQPVE